MESQEVVLRGELICSSDDQNSIVQQFLPQHVELTRLEPGCLSFEVQQTADPLVWSVSERFVNREAFEAHQVRVKSSEWGIATVGIERRYEISAVNSAEA